MNIRCCHFGCAYWRLRVFVMLFWSFQCVYVIYEFNSSWLLIVQCWRVCFHGRLQESTNSTAYAHHTSTAVPHCSHVHWWHYTLCWYYWHLHFHFVHCTHCFVRDIMRLRVWVAVMRNAIRRIWCDCFSFFKRDFGAFAFIALGFCKFMSLCIYFRIFSLALNCILFRQTGWFDFSKTRNLCCISIMYSFLSVFFFKFAKYQFNLDFVLFASF